MSFVRLAMGFIPQWTQQINSVVGYIEYRNQTGQRYSFWTIWPCMCWRNNQRVLQHFYFIWEILEKQVSNLRAKLKHVAPKTNVPWNFKIFMWAPRRARCLLRYQEQCSWWAIVPYSLSFKVNVYDYLCGAENEHRQQRVWNGEVYY